MDPLGVLLAGGLDIADNGAFTCVLIGVGGEALVRVRVRDDGGTANQGVDLSAAAEFTIAFAPSADLQVEKDDGCNGVQIGETLVYSITVANAGPNAAVGATVADDIPPTLAEAEWACVEASSNATCPPAPFDTGTGDMTTTIDLPVDAFLRFELSATMLG